MRSRIAVIVALISVSALAQEMTPLERPKGAPVTVSQYFTQFHHATPRRPRGRMHGAPNVIYGESADSAFIIPAAGNLAGANGTFFRSDFTLGNFANRNQIIGVAWLAAGVDNTNEQFTYFTIPANTIIAYQDYVGQQLHRTGLGAILVIAFTDTTGNTTDDTAILDGFSRIWTPEAGVANATVSQNFPAISVNDSFGIDPAYAMGLRQDGSFRTNVGIVNLDQRQHTWNVQALTGATSQVTVQPYSLSQGGAPAGSANSIGAVSLIITPVDDTVTSWSAYASTVDNVSGDGWVSRATQ